MIGVMIVPTGLGAKIGGHAGDANPVAKLLAECCDTLIVHPNVVNASDINEMTENMLYVEGSMLDNFLNGGIRLKQKYQNKILVVVNKPVRADTMNAVNAARNTIGANIELVELSCPLKMVANKVDGRASGTVLGWEELVNQVRDLDFDVMAIHSIIDCEGDVAEDYFKNGGVNPWGGVEAVVSRLVSESLNKPVAHAPLENLRVAGNAMLGMPYKIVVDPRIAAEIVSVCYLHCVLKGLNKAPVISHSGGIVSDDVDFMVSPVGCWGDAHKACVHNNIPIYMIRENTLQVLAVPVPVDKVTYVDTYLEFAGILMAKKAGVTPRSVRAS